jgi:hypothetical protein
MLLSPYDSWLYFDRRQRPRLPPLIGRFFFTLRNQGIEEINNSKLSLAGGLMVNPPLGHMGRFHSEAEKEWSMVNKKIRNYE